MRDSIGWMRRRRSGQKRKTAALLDDRTIETKFAYDDGDVPV
jgi:hypothetical protein